MKFYNLYQKAFWERERFNYTPPYMYVFFFLLLHREAIIVASCNKTLFLSRCKSRFIVAYIEPAAICHRKVRRVTRETPPREHRIASFFESILNPGRSLIHIRSGCILLTTGGETDRPARASVHPRMNYRHGRRNGHEIAARDPFV